MKGNDDSQLLLYREENETKINKSSRLGRSTIMFSPCAEEHYFGSIVVTNGRGSILNPNTSVLVRNTQLEGDTNRRTAVAKSPYADTRITQTATSNSAAKNRRSASFNDQKQ